MLPSTHRLVSVIVHIDQNLVPWELIFHFHYKVTKQKLGICIDTLCFPIPQMEHHSLMNLGHRIYLQIMENFNVTWCPYIVLLTWPDPVIASVLPSVDKLLSASISVHPESFKIWPIIDCMVISICKPPSIKIILLSSRSACCHWNYFEIT